MYFIWAFLTAVVHKPEVLLWNNEPYFLRRLAELADEFSAEQFDLLLSILNAALHVEDEHDWHITEVLEDAILALMLALDRKKAAL